MPQTHLSKLTLSGFGSWITQQCQASYKASANRVDCVIDCAHIEPGSYAALYAYLDSSGLMIAELDGYFPSQEEAWEALADDQAPTFPPEPFNEWITTEFLTDTSAKVHILAL